MLKVFYLLFLTTSLTFAQSDYYPKAFLDGVESGQLKDKELIAEIHKVVKMAHRKTKEGHDVLTKTCSGKDSSCYRQQSFGYRRAREVLFGKIHLKKDKRGYWIEDVYCQNVYRDTQINIGPMKVPTASKINCEHTWPKSRFNHSINEKKSQLTDLHHLYPTDTKANSTRSSFYFGEVKGDVVANNCRTSRIGQGRGRVLNFEPPDEHKGNVARALFYFSVRYQLNISSSEETFLRKWHREDPVDDAEKRRVNIIFEYQRNRNPFVDMPHLVDKIKNF